ncbi:hypothetical protein LTR78_005891 [Recurvomyces mirabilis]|uniref:MFS general substrate transporter n=1 Tax=Recurvomyces mirabilis TaxID=574656 RepID=A0AAE0WMI5_9PEZI|nr:hypothetical protein LTR78_005891 [Recurvomyces mirabilis]KAK5154272.1 hypothetical protein LTS14_006957 [Recurvomyces mirabilis]
MMVACRANSLNNAFKLGVLPPPPRTSIDSTTSDLDHLLSNEEQENEEDDDDDQTEDESLPPIDRGKGAYSFLLGCWLIEAMIWAFPLAFGVFQSHYTNHFLFKSSSHLIPTVGTLATGLSYLLMPLTNAIALRWPQHRRTMCCVGWIMCIFGLLGASLATHVWELLLWQGVVYGTGWVVCYTPLLFMLNEWFVRRRGLAYGILFGASGVTGLFIPVCMEWLLERYGFRVALRVYALITIVVSAPGLWLIRPRKPAGRVPKAQKKKLESDSDSLRSLRPFLTNKHFLLLAFAVFTQGLGFFIPNIYIPSYASDLGLSSAASSSLLALISLSQVLGQIWQGWISDRVNIYIPTAVSALVPGVGALLLWGPAKNMATLVPFVMVWGFFSASYSVLFTRMCTFLASDARGMDGNGDPEGTTMLLYGFFSFERGVSNVLEGPISSWLIGSDKAVNATEYGLGRYAIVIWFTVVCMLASSSVVTGWMWRPMR